MDDGRTGVKKARRTCSAEDPFSDRTRMCLWSFSCFSVPFLTGIGTEKREERGQGCGCRGDTLIMRLFLVGAVVRALPEDVLILVQ